MTWRPPWWVAPLAVGIAVLAVVWALNGRRSAISDLEREREAVELERQGFTIAHEVSAKKLADMIATSQVLVEEIARLQAAAPGAKPTGHVSGSTGPQPLPPVASPGTATTPPAAGGASPGASCPPCLLTSADTLDLRFRVVTLETKAGNVVAVGVGEAYRGDGQKLLEAPLRLEVGTPERPRVPGWGLGPIIGGVITPQGGGWFVGGIGTTPSVRLLFGLEGALVAGGGGGPNGVAAVWAGALIR